MSDGNKTISINPALFNMGKNKTQTKKNKQKAQNRNFSIIAPNSVKTDFIRRVKQHQKDKQKQNNELDNNKSKKIKSGLFSEDFQNSLDYMKELSEIKKKKELKAQENIKVQPSTDVLKEFMKTDFSSQNNNNFNSEIVEMELPDTLIVPGKPQSMIHNSVPFGCLKNGNKPTYRKWLKQTQKNKLNKNDILEKKVSPLININSENKDNINNEKIDIMLDINDDNNNNDNINIDNKPKIQIPIKFITKRTKRRKYTCGKSKKHRKVGIVLKSGKMRTKVLEEKRDLKFKPVIDVKNELCKSGLLKIGSSAPKPLLYEIYEHSTLTGDVINKNKDVLLHNYLNENENF
jgi:hypothetical protein